MTGKPRTYRSFQTRAVLPLALISLLGGLVAYRAKVRSTPRLAPAAQTADIWKHGDEQAVQDMIQSELAIVPEAQKERRMKALVRAALISDNPEGQSALLSQACSLDVEVCRSPGGMKALAKSEAAERTRPPGNHLPIIFFGPEHTAENNATHPPR